MAKGFAGEVGKSLGGLGQDAGVVLANALDVGGNIEQKIQRSRLSRAALLEWSERFSAAVACRSVEAYQACVLELSASVALDGQGRTETAEALGVIGRLRRDEGAVNIMDNMGGAEEGSKEKSGFSKWW